MKKAFLAAFILNVALIHSVAAQSAIPDDKSAIAKLKKMTLKKESVAQCAPGLNACTGAGYMVCCSANCGHTAGGVPYCY